MTLQLSDKHIGASPSDPPPINIVDFDHYRINSTWSGSSTHEILEDEEAEAEDHLGGGRRLTPSITEEYDEANSRDMFSCDIDRNGGDVVYVVAWKGNDDELSSASMDALVWTLTNAVHESTIVYLVHVFPELRYIPTPLGKLPISQANPDQKEGYLIQERSKRSEYLQRFLRLCSSSKVNVETVLIESDMEAKAILDLIPILNIRKLVLGTSKSTLKKIKNGSKKGGGGTVDRILHNVPESCEVKVICEGKEVLLQDQPTTESPSPSLTAPSPCIADVSTPRPRQVQQDNNNGFVRCSCFKL